MERVQQPKMKPSMDRTETRVTRDQGSPKVEFFRGGYSLVVTLDEADTGDDNHLILKAKAVIAELIGSQDETSTSPPQDPEDVDATPPPPGPPANFER